MTGADMTSGTPIYDVKPYLPFTDSHPDALGGFAESEAESDIEVVFPDELREKLPPELIPGLIDILASDPRPHYHDDPERVYGFLFAEHEVFFTVRDGVLRVCDIIRK